MYEEEVGEDLSASDKTFLKTEESVNKPYKGGQPPVCYKNLVFELKLYASKQFLLCVVVLRNHQSVKASL